MNEPSIPEVKYHARFKPQRWQRSERGENVLVDVLTTERCDWDCTELIKSLTDEDRARVEETGTLDAAQLEDCEGAPQFVREWNKDPYTLKITRLEGFTWTAVVLDVTKYCNFGVHAKWIQRAGSIHAFRKDMHVHCAEITPSYELWPAQGVIYLTDEASEILSDTFKEALFDFESKIAPTEVEYHHVVYLDRMRKDSPHRFVDMFIEWDESLGTDPRHMEDKGYEGRVREDLIHEVTNDIHL